MTTTYDYRPALNRTVAIANGKGGVGKTTTACAVGGLLATQGYRVLIVDLDPQANTAQDLGFTCAGCTRCRQSGATPDTELCDFGTGLSRAVQFGETPFVRKDVRGNLDVIPGGGALDELAAVITARRNSGGQREALAARLALAGTLAPLAAGYDIVLLDCPPQNREIQEAALATARYLLIPTKTDASSLKGLDVLADRFSEARQINPTLELLGVLVFGTTAAAKIPRADAAEWVEAALGGGYVFKATVRHVEAVAARVRKYGLLPHELELGPEFGVKPAEAKGAVGLAGDMEKVTTEMLGRLIAAEQRMNEEVDNG